MTLKAKLNFSFIALVSLVLLMGVFGLVQLARVNAVAHDLATLLQIAPHHVLPALIVHVG